MTLNNTLPVTRLTGNRTALGEAHGRTHAGLIQASIGVYDRLFHDFVGIDWQKARREAVRFLPMIELGFPAILEEMEGIARGAGLDLDDILTLNCRSEISLTKASGGCSAFALQRDGQQWLAQNWDWRTDQLHNLVVLDIHSESAAPLVSIGEAGMVAKIGMNANGIGVCLNAIRSRTCGEGLPIHIALRKILESPDMESALAVATRDRVCSPAHFLIASAPFGSTRHVSEENQAVGLEVHPGEPGRLATDEGVVTHTNHLFAHAATSQVEDFPRPDSRSRLARLDQRLRKELTPDTEIDEAALFTILSDHDNAPLSICRHFNPAQPPEERMETLFSVVMNLSERRLSLRHGKPCETEQTLVVPL